MYTKCFCQGFATRPTVASALHRASIAGQLSLEYYHKAFKSGCIYRISTQQPALGDKGAEKFDIIHRSMYVISTQYKRRISPILKSSIFTDFLCHIDPA